MVTEIEIHCWVKANSSWTRGVVAAYSRGAISWERGNLTQRFSLFAHAVVQFDNVILSSRPQSTAGQDQVIYREGESVKENMHRYTQTDKVARNNRHRDASRWKMAPFLFSRTFLFSFLCRIVGRATIYFFSLRAFLPLNHLDDKSILYLPPPPPWLSDVLNHH